MQANWKFHNVTTGPEVERAPPRLGAALPLAELARHAKPRQEHRAGEARPALLGRVLGPEDLLGKAWPAKCSIKGTTERHCQLAT